MSHKRTMTENQQGKITGVILAILCVVSIFTMLHHPSVSSENIYEQIQEINHESQVNILVHGVLIAFILFTNICLTYYAKTRGLNRSSVLYGLIVYWVGTVVMVLAALLGGIVGPQLAEHYAQATVHQAEVFKGIFLLVSEMNLAFASCSIFCWCAGMCCWGFDMLHQTKTLKLFGLASLLAAFTMTLSLLVGWVTLSVFGTTIILMVISAWQLGIACSLYWQATSTS